MNSRRSDSWRWPSAVLLVAALVGAAWAAAPHKCARYAFDLPEQLGRSTGLTPWPALAFRAQAAEGRAGGGLAMDGRQGNGLLLPNPAAFFGPSAEAGTIALWVRPDFEPSAEEGQRVIIDFMKEARNTRIDGYEIVMLADGDKLAAQAALGRRMVVATPLAKGRWTHLALTWDAAVGSALYIGGTLAAERRGRFAPTPLTSWPGRLGSHTPWGAYAFRGTVDDLCVLDHRIGAAQAAELARQGPEATRIEVTGWKRDVLRVRNRGDASAVVWLREWLAEDGMGSAAWGHLPVPEDEVGPQEHYVGGASGTVHQTTKPVLLAAGDRLSLNVPYPGDYLRWRRLSVMTGAGWHSLESAAQDRLGLSLELEPRLGSAAEPTAARLVVRNDTGQRYVGWLQGGFFLPSGKRLAGVVDLKIHLKHGRKWRAGVDLPRQAGGYTLRLSGTNPSGGWSPLRRVAVHVVEPEDYHHAVGVGAAYTQHPPSPELLRRMAEDGVKVVRRSRGRWHTEPHTIHPYGLKMWYTAAYSSRRICVARERLAEAEQLARRLGECHKDKPTVLNQVMLGEGLSRSPCYCPQCTDAFRRYLRRTHGRLSRLNARWATRYPSFDAIQQLGSPADVDHAAERMALMQRKMPTEVSRRWSELFRLEPGRAIDWKRWHDGVLIDWYRRFARAYHKANRHTTALSEQPCWPNFKHHVLFALGETADLGGMDLYLPGELPATLGYASELMCNFDLNASVFHGKPLWLHELYVQHNSPPGLAEAQGWWLVGRGYRMLSYFTYDHYREGVRAKLPLIFGLFDPQWKPYPCYESFARFSAQVAKFHSEYDLLSLRREEPRVALFLGDDQSLANWLETGGETWGASGVHGHVGAWWLTQRCGFPVEFINEQRFDRLRGKSVLIVPWTHVVGQRALERILRFARRGGTLILDGPVGLYDEHYRAYASLPGGRAFDRLGIRFAGYQEKPNELLFMRRRSLIDVAPETRLPTRGVPFRVKVAAEGKVLAWDGQGSAGLVQRRVGRGQVFALLTSLGRTQRSRRPAPEAVALWGAMLRSAGLRAHHAVTVAGGAEDTPAVDLDHGGAGLKLGGPLCDVALRRRGKDELFVFVVSFFAPTRATVTLRLAEAAYKADDALSHDPVLLRGGGGGGYSFPIDLPAFGAKVIRVRCTSGALELEGRVRLSR